MDSFQRQQRRIGGLQAAVDLLIEVDLLVVVVEANTGQHAQATPTDHATWPNTAALVLA